METKLRIAFSLGLLLVGALEGPRAGALLAEAFQGPYGIHTAPATTLEALRHADPRGRPEPERDELASVPLERRG